MAEKSENKVKDPQVHPMVFMPAQTVEAGITLKDQLAGQCMQGIVASLTGAYPDAIANQMDLWVKRWGETPVMDCIAKDSYMLANAMLKERMNHQ